MKVLNDRAYLPTISRVFATHSQIVFEILENNGSNNYLKNGEMHFGVHHDCCVDEEGGVNIPVPVLKVEWKVFQSQIISNRQVRFLKHD